MIDAGRSAGYIPCGFTAQQWGKYMRLKSMAVGVPACFFVSGCARRSAPTLSLFGAYFPIWILCGLVGVLAAAAARLILVKTGLAEVVPAQLLVCSGAGLIAACLLWLLLSH